MTTLCRSRMRLIGQTSPQRYRYETESTGVTGKLALGRVRRPMGR